MNKLTKLKMYIFINRYILLPLFGKKRLLNLFFKMKTGKIINFDNPEGYNEKIQLRKLEENNSDFILCADKVEVRNYVKKIIGEKYLIPLYFEKEKINLTDILNLPKSFALKTNNASQTNIIVFDKEKENLDDMVSKMNKYVKLKYGYAMLELFYNNIKPKIIAEKLLVDSNGEVPYDYKFHCFKVDDDYEVYIQVDYDRFSNHKRNMYNSKWHLLDYTLGFESENKEIEKPKKLKKMLKLAKELASEFSYVRVDFYLCNNEIYFGELTFTHGSGYEEFMPGKYDADWGKLWKETK